MTPDIDFDDLVELVALMRKFHAQSRFHDVPFNADKVVHGIAQARQNNDTFFIRLKRSEEGKIVGFFFGYLTDIIFSDEVVAENIVFYTDPNARGGVWFARTLKEFEEWAWEQNACKVIINHNSGIDCEKAIPFFERQGYKTVGALFSKDI